MALLDLIDDADPLIDGEPVSVTTLMSWRQTLLAIDDATRLHQEAYCGGFGNPQERGAVNPYQESWGAYRHHAGLSTMVVITNSWDVAVGSDQLRLYCNGTLIITWALANGIQVHSAGLPAAGENQAVDVVFEVSRAGAPGDGVIFGTYEIIGAFVGPVSTESVPAAPTFTDTIEIAKTQQLANGIDALSRIVGQRTRPLFQSLIRWVGPFFDQETQQSQTEVRWVGGIEHSPIHPILKAQGAVIVWAPGATEVVRLRANGATVASFAVPETPGEHGFTLTATITAAVGSRIYLEVDHLRTAEGSPAPPPTRLSLFRVWAEEDGSVPALTIPELSVRTPLTWATLRTFFAACSSAVTTLAARIAANPDLWERQYLFRRRYAFTEGQSAWFEPTMVAARFGRAGQALLVRGRSLTLGSGPVTFEANPTVSDGTFYQFTALRSESVVDGDDVESTLVYLDQIPGLYLGDPYHIRGVACHYAGEILRLGL